jgi:Carboxypeptidase regulatory-like domain
MRTVRFAALALVVSGFFVLLPTPAAAQSAISGVVSDNTGAVLPGVTIEASSPVLIEKTRTVVSDGQGRYTIVNLRPGTYKVTFTLTGFGTVVRDGLQLPADFTATLSVQLSVGALEESVTVSGQSPVVDIQTAARTLVITRDVLDALPTPRNTQSFGYLAQGVRLSKPDVGGAQMMEQVNMRVHGASQLHTTMQIDGMLVSPAFSDGAIQNYINQAAFAETAFTTSSQGAEVSAGGVRVNMIPRDGGNSFHGSLYAGGTAGSWQSNNLTPELIAKGLTLPTGITHIYDINPAVGGPLLQDKLWYFASMRWMSVNERVVNAYMPDGSPAIVDQYVNIPLVRLTYQATPKNKFSAFLDRPLKYKGREFTFGIEPSRASRRRNPGEANYHNFGAKLTSTVSNRMLYELGFTEIVERLHTGYQPYEFPTTEGWPRPANVHLSTTGPNVDPWFRDVSHYDILTRERTVATTAYTGTLPDRRHVTTALSYVTGSHNFKTGFQWSFGQDRNDAMSNGDLQEQRYRTGVPESVVVTINPYATEEYVKADMGIYGQDTWRIKRLTVNAGLRYEYFNSMVKEQWRAEGRFVPGAIFPEVRGVPIWHDLSPRFGLVYDLFGDAKTAVKFGANRYMRPMAGSFAKRYNPIRGLATDVRDWFDVDLIPGTSIRSGIPKPTDRDDLVQDSEIGPSNNANFGKTSARHAAPDLKRESNIEYTAGVQRELMPNLSVTFAWYHRQYYRLIAEDNVLLEPSDYRSFQAANPLGNGEMITIYNLNPAKRALVDILEYNSSNNTHIANDLEVSFNSRLPNGSTVFGGWNASRNVAVSCDQENPNGSAMNDLYFDISFQRGGRFCDERALGIPFRHDFKLAGTLPLPYGLEFSGTIVSFAGNETQVVWDVPASVFPNAQRTAQTLVRLTPPGTLYLDRWNQTDIAFKKNFPLGRYTFTAQADIYNALNAAPVTTETVTYGPSLGFPNTILQGRLLRLVAQMRW